MNIKYILFILLLTGLVSCYHENKPEIKKPDPFIPEDRFVDIIVDIQIAEGVISQRRLNKVSVSNGFKDSVYQVVFDHYGINARQLAENMDYYNNDPKNMEKIYDKVLAKLSKIEAGIPVNDTVADQKQ